VVNSILNTWYQSANIYPSFGPLSSATAAFHERLLNATCILLKII